MKKLLGTCYTNSEKGQVLLTELVQDLRVNWRNPDHESRVEWAMKLKLTDRKADQNGMIDTDWGF